MAFYWGSTSKFRMEGVNPYLVECITRVLNKSKIDLTIPWMGGVREAKEQNALFKQGNSKLDGYENLSYHQIEASDNGFGNALDVRPVGWSKMTASVLNRWGNYIGRMMMIEWQEMIFEYGQEGIDIGVMIWGGTFGATSWDRPHFEVRQ